MGRMNRERSRAAAATGRTLGLRALIAAAVAFGGVTTWLAAGGPGTAGASGGGNLAPLSTLPVPAPAGEATYIKDKSSAVRLGKALF